MIESDGIVVQFLFGGIKGVTEPQGFNLYTCLKPALCHFQPHIVGVGIHGSWRWRQRWQRRNIKFVFTRQLFVHHDQTASLSAPSKPKISRCQHYHADSSHLAFRCLHQQWQHQVSSLQIHCEQDFVGNIPTASLFISSLCVTFGKLILVTMAPDLRIGAWASVRQLQMDLRCGIRIKAYAVSCSREDRSLYWHFWRHKVCVLTLRSLARTDKACTRNFNLLWIEDWKTILEMKIVENDHYWWRKEIGFRKRRPWIRTVFLPREALRWQLCWLWVL